MKLARLLVPALALAATLASAENLDMATGNPDAALPARPAPGITMVQVEKQFGPPVTRHAAVGKPPITRWDYPQFSVFFEYDRVIHAVIVRPAGN